MYRPQPDSVAESSLVVDAEAEAVAATVSRAARYRQEV
jgi:hypothetical protein